MAGATAGITGLFTLVAFGNNVTDGLVLLAATLTEAVAAWVLLQRPNPNQPPPLGVR